MDNIRKEIEEELKKIEEENDVKVLYAVESGSRAWGVASPDSDYDVRFVYAHSMEYYLKLQEVKDIIDWKLDEVLDINGWDLKKTLIQFYKGNATLFEWANSPVIYKSTKEWNSIYNAAGSYFSEKVALYHYYGTAKSTYEQYLTKEQISYKKYIYALRPLLACKYIKDNHKIPPVLFSELIKQEIPQNLKSEIEQVLKIKSSTDEKMLNPQMPFIQEYIQEELIKMGIAAKEMADDRTKDWEALNKVFLDIVLK